MFNNKIVVLYVLQVWWCHGFGR